MKKLAIFDLDGTLLDTIEDIAYKVNLAMAHFGYPLITKQEAMQKIGNGSRMLIKRSIGENESEQRLDQVLRYFMNIYAGDADPKTKPFDGIKETLLKLHDKGFILAIITNKPQPATDKVCGELLSDIPFYKVIGQSQAVECKPNPDSTLSLLKELNVEPQNAYFIGDGDADVLTAINSKINHISVLWGYRTKTQLEQVGASNFVSTPQDLLNFLLS